MISLEMVSDAVAALAWKSLTMTMMMMMLLMLPCLLLIAVYVDGVSNKSSYGMSSSFVDMID